MATFTIEISDQDLTSHAKQAVDTAARAFWLASHPGEPVMLETPMVGTLPLRDHAALAILLCLLPLIGNAVTPAAGAGMAYRYADALLEARTMIHVDSRKES